MVRYIKLEDAIEVCGKYKNLHKKENSKLGMAIVNDIYLDIDNLPTADVEEVKHGCWVDCIEAGTTVAGIEFSGLVGYKCSLCGRYEGKKEPYCNCGAKMVGVKSYANTQGLS